MKTKDMELSTFINTLIEAGFIIERVIEGDVSEEYKDKINDELDRYYSLHKARYIPNTFMIKARNY